MSVTIQLRKKGTLTLPRELRRKYGLEAGDALTLLDVGDGFLFLTPRAAEVNRQWDRVGQILEEEGVTLEELLEVLDEEREKYYQEHYARTETVPGQ